jgi:transposase
MRQRRSFSKDFKVKAVKAVIEEGRLPAHVARELDIHQTQLSIWREKLGGTIQKGTVSEVLQIQKQLEAVQKELRAVQQERDMFKRALNVLTGGEVTV